MNKPTTNHDDDRSVNLAIVGGGIAGICLALGTLNHAPYIRFHIYEAAAKFQEIGAGVAFGINAQRTLRRLDPRAGESYARIAISNSDLNMQLVTVGNDAQKQRKDTYLRVLMGMDHVSDPDFKDGDEIAEVFCEGEFSSVHRVRFLDEMVALLPEEVREKCVSFGRRLIGVEDLDPRGSNTTTGVRLLFADGSSAVADSVIGCDGIRSRVRQELLGSSSTEVNPVFTGKYAYRGLIPMHKAVARLGDRLARNGHHHIGYGGHVLNFPIEHSNTLNVVAFRTKPDECWDDDNWIQTASKESMKQDFAGYGSNVHAILDLMETRDKWALFDHPPASTYRRQRRICVMGDAAHASTPHQGSGAGMAIEDTIALSSLLGKVKHPEELQYAFEAYEAVRKERTQRLVEASREQATMYDLENMWLGDDVEAILRLLPNRWD